MNRQELNHTIKSYVEDIYIKSVEEELNKLTLNELKWVLGTCVDFQKRENSPFCLYQVSSNDERIVNVKFFNPATNVGEGLSYLNFGKK